MLMSLCMLDFFIAEKSKRLAMQKLLTCIICEDYPLSWINASMNPHPYPLDS